MKPKSVSVLLPLSVANTKYRNRRFAGCVLVSDCESLIYRDRPYAYGRHGATGVMNEWQAQQKADNVLFLPDGNGDFSRGMGMLVPKTDLGFGERSWRYSMLVEDGSITKLFSEPGMQDDCPTDPFEISDADTLLAYIRGSQQDIAA